jgi:hypothetical protein
LKIQRAAGERQLPRKDCSYDIARLATDEKARRFVPAGFDR